MYRHLFYVPFNIFPSMTPHRRRGRRKHRKEEGHKGGLTTEESAGMLSGGHQAGLINEGQGKDN